MQEALLADRKVPQYLVMFKDDKADNSPIIYSTMGLMGVMAAPDLNGIRHIPSAHEGGCESAYYEDMGVAALDLTDDQAQAITDDETVEMVVKNELRRIPPFLQSNNSAKPDQKIELTWCLRNIGLSLDYPYDGTSVNVAVLDTGIDLSHPDFSHQTLFTESFIPGQSVQDGNGHGTHCCGIVAGSPTPLQGPRYSVAPHAHLMVGKVLSNEGTGYDDGIIRAMQWAARNGANVISMSLGSPRAVGSGYNALYERVASRLAANYNILVVAAAGNESRRPGYTEPVGNPAACPSVLAVAAVDRNNTVADFSCAEMDALGSLDLCAPGVDVNSAWTGGGYLAIDGTSMACPHVAGAACLHFQANPGVSASDLWTLMTSARSLIPLPNKASPIKADYGHGLIQL